MTNPKQIFVMINPKQNLPVTPYISNGRQVILRTTSPTINMKAMKGGSGTRYCGVHRLERTRTSGGTSGGTAGGVPRCTAFRY